MNVIQRPREREFCGTMQDYIIDTDNTITFAILYGGKTILKEEYVPDANYQVRVRQLGKFCELALWGVWCAGETSWQYDAAGVFTFLINGIQDAQCYVMFSRLQTRKDATAPGWLTEVNQKVTFKDTKEYLSCLMKKNDTIKIIAYAEDGVGAEKTHFQCEVNEITPVTVDVSYSSVNALFPSIDLYRYKVLCNSNEFLFHINRTPYANTWCFRFKNVYDMPETLTASGELKLAGSNESANGTMYGVDRKFGIRITDEYTVNSGVVILQSDYKLWHNLLNAQEVDVRVDGEWLPIIISKQKFERSFRKSILKTVEFSFQLANPEQNNLIEI